ncbi:hypothetical protein DQP57_00245 [Mycobacterium colombiense]|uniref:Uncharacterized protein n=1 Tax=Mycobacterium colombiense TaxID=339268 RepID=A0A329MBY2_9MYCO|nr:hypothetical protein DQP57_00245 [Mycobacterium colombiense]
MKVLLNNSAAFRGYTAGDDLTEAIVFQSSLPACGHIEMLLKIVFSQLNKDDPGTTWAQEYRRNGNRSLSVGDVVVIGETAYACEPMGWKRVTLLTLVGQ